jgi:ABC-type nitrate/sulfonate/bicarbonate transport system substrate-binding protein
MNSSRRRLLATGALLPLAGGAAPCLASAAAEASASRLPIKIANASGALNLTMAELMRRERYLESFGLSPDIIGVADGTRILGGIVGGSIDASLMSGFGQVFPAIDRGAPLKIIGGGALLPMLALFSARPDIKTLKDLEGRTLGTGSIGALVYQLTVTLLRKYQVDTTKIRFVNIGSNADIFRAVGAGTIDAGAGEAALISEAARYGVHLIEHGDMSVELPEFTYQAAWTSDRAIATRRGTLVRALAAYARLYRLVQSPAGRQPFLAARRAVFAKAPESEHLANWNFIQRCKPFAVNLSLEPERLRYLQAINIDFKVQKSPLAYERVANMSLAVEALALLRSQETSQKTG